MALFPRPAKPAKGQKQYWTIRFRIPTGKRNKNGRLIYKVWQRSIGEVGKMTKAKAREKHDTERSRIGKNGAPEEVTLGDFAADFIVHNRDVKNKRSWVRDVYALKRLIEHIGEATMLNDITVRTVDAYKAKRRRLVKAATVNRELECLRSMLFLAIRWNMFSGTNPVTLAGTLKEVRERKVPLTFDEEDALLKNTNEAVSLIVVFAINTGMRISEIVRLEEKAVAFDKDEGMYYLRIEATEQKGGRYREVPLNDVAYDCILKSRERKKKFIAERAKLKKDGKPEEAYKGPRIFLHTKGEPYSHRFAVYHSILKACKKAGIRKVTPHLFRHTFATRKIESGADPIAVQEIMGEADLKTMLGYVHLRRTKFSTVTLGVSSPKPPLRVVE